MTKVTICVIAGEVTLKLLPLTPGQAPLILAGMASLKKHLVLLASLMSLATLSLVAEPYWWGNAHRDDDDFMYDRGTASGCASEEEAIQSAVGAAKKSIEERIGIIPALKEEGIEASAEYAIVDCEIKAQESEHVSQGWSAWILLRYSQKSKELLLSRWQASLASLKDLRAREAPIPLQFNLTLGTADGRHQYHSGDSIVLTARADRDCCLLIVDHQSDGSAVILFPNRFHPDSRITADQRISIPSPADTAFKILVTAPFGDDRIEAIASTQRTGLFDRVAELLSKLEGGQRLASDSREGLIRSINEAVAASPKGNAWSKADFVLSTYQ